MTKPGIATKKISILVSDNIGKVSGVAVVPDHPVAVLVLAHGAGAGMMHNFLVTLSTELAARSIATLRYNFPFKENGKGRPDPPAIAEKTVNAALNKALELFPERPIFAAGKSFGGRMSSHLLSKSPPDFVRGIVYFGFPLHAPGKPSVDRAEHLKSIELPMLFLQGTRDALATIDLIEKVVKKLRHATLKKFEGADHSFKSGKKEFIPELAGETSIWVQNRLG